MSKRLFKGIVAVLIANIINMFFNVVTNFALPKYLSIDSYSYIKTFQLYSGYIGIFALGYSDGMYIKYGGRNLNEIGKNEIEKGLGTLRVLMLLESLLFIVASQFLHNTVFKFFVFTLLSVNTIGYYKNLFQAIGEFRLYSRILNVSTILKFISDMMLLFLIRTDNFKFYLLGYVLIDLLIWILLEYYFQNSYKTEIKNFLTFDYCLLLDNIKTGFLLMVGNFSSILLTGMDRWFIKWKMSNIEFAQYSFAVSLEGFLNVAITPVTVTLYNYFCNHDEEKTVVSIRRIMFIFASLLIAAAFPAKFVIELLLDKYLESLKPLFILFGAQLFFTPNKAIYINLYKAKGQQSIYFRRLLSVLMFGFASNYILFQLYGFKESFAYATMLSAIFWITRSIFDFKEYRFELKEVFFCICVIAVFLICGFSMNAIVGMMVYVGTVGVLAFCVFREEIIMAMSKIKGWLPKRA